MSSFPLLGAVAASFKVIENYEICRNNDIKIAAVDVGYMTPDDIGGSVKVIGRGGTRLPFRTKAEVFYM